MEISVHEFIKIYFDQLSADMARGKGEHLASLAALMGFREEQREIFAKAAKRK